jgi:hypothetical protein
MSEVKKTLSEIHETLGYGVTDDDDSLSEILTECGEEVWRGDYEQHRWYHECLVVKKFGDKFIAYWDYEVQGDNSAIDMGLDDPIETAYFVTPKEKTITVYE